jgi:hypothetical protein
MSNNNVFSLPANYSLEKAIETVSAKLNPKWIDQRKQGTATLSYIGGHIVIRLLNQAFNYQWSFEVVSEEIVPSLPKPAFTGYGQQRKAVLNQDGSQKMEPQPPAVKVLGRLTVPGLGVKEQYGSKVLIGGATEQESAFKSASTDALKKCASLFGIGLDLYGEAEGFENQAHQEYLNTPYVAPAPTAPVQQPAPQQPPVQEAPATPPYQTASQAQADGNLAAQQQTPANQGGTVLTPNVQAAPAETPAATSGPARQFAWPPAEVQKMIDLKGQLGVTDNSQLTPYVREFLNNAEVTIQNITPDNITAFNVFLQGKLS